MLTPEQHATREYVAIGILKAIRMLSIRPVPRGRPGTPPKNRKPHGTEHDGPTGHSVKSFYRALRRGWRPLEYVE